jgi:PAS domain S-box-containing protein
MLRLSDATLGASPEVRAALDRLILRRGRLLMLLGFFAVATFSLLNHLAWRSPPLWTDLMNAAITAVLGGALLLTSRPVGERHIVAICLTLGILGAGVRAWAGIWHGDVAPTAIFLLVMAMTSAAALPWGFWAQLLAALTHGAAVTINAYAVLGGLGPPPRHAAAAVALGLAGSVVLAAEMRRHHIQLFVDNVRRRAAEAALARLNAELERRVDERTAQLTATTGALEREAHERHHAEAELRESQRRLQAVLDHADVAIYLRDLDDRYLLVNRYWLRLAGRQSDEILGHTLDEIMPPEVAANVRAHDAEVLRAPHSLQFEEHIPQIDGWHTFVTVKFAWLGPDGRPVGIWGLATDITDRKQAETELRQRQAELAHVLRLSTMGEMAASLAHEINQPLGAIANFAQGCVRRMRAGTIDLDGLFPVVEQIGSEALRAGEIIRRLRDLVRKDSGQQAPTDVNHLVRESVRLIEPEARARGVDLHTELAPTLPPVSCNGVQIEQVLLNLLLNGVEAVEAAADGHRALAVRTVLQERSIEVAVTDSGVGLPEQSTDVFAPFFTTKTSGLGMGLSISRSIIEAHGGHLWGVRNPDRGSTFHFTLPLRG